jgi:hypothetical protein
MMHGKTKSRRIASRNSDLDVAHHETVNKRDDDIETIGRKFKREPP